MRLGFGSRAAQPNQRDHAHLHPTVVGAREETRLPQSERWHNEEVRHPPQGAGLFSMEEERFMHSHRQEDTHFTYTHNSKQEQTPFQETAEESYTTPEETELLTADKITELCNDFAAEGPCEHCEKLFPIQELVKHEVS